MHHIVSIGKISKFPTLGMEVSKNPLDPQNGEEKNLAL